MPGCRLCLTAPLKNCLDVIAPRPVLFPSPLLRPRRQIGIHADGLNGAPRSLPPVAGAFRKNPWPATDAKSQPTMTRRVAATAKPVNIMRLRVVVVMRHHRSSCPTHLAEGRNSNFIAVKSDRDHKNFYSDCWNRHKGHLTRKKLWQCKTQRPPHDLLLLQRSDIAKLVQHFLSLRVWPELHRIGKRGALAFATPPWFGADGWFVHAATLCATL